MANVEQAQQMMPLITCEISLSQYVCELVFLVSLYLIWILESRLIRSNNQTVQVQLCESLKHVSL